MLKVFFFFKNVKRLFDLPGGCWWYNDGVSWSESAPQFYPWDRIIIQTPTGCITTKEIHIVVVFLSWNTPKKKIHSPALSWGLHHYTNTHQLNYTQRNWTKNMWFLFSNTRSRNFYFSSQTYKLQIWDCQLQLLTSQELSWRINKNYMDNPMARVS